MMLIRIDLWLLARLEKFAHRFQTITGRNCFWLARVFTLLAGFSAGYLVTIAYLTFRANRSLAVWTGVVSFFLFLEVLFVFISIRVIEINISEIQTGLANPFKYVEQFDRIWRIIAYPVYTLIWATGFYLIYRLSLISVIFCSSAFIWLIIAWYLKCCDPLPPAKSKVKQWKEKFVNAVKGVFAPAPQPSPVPCE